MSEIKKDDTRKFYAETYDTVMEDWPGEFEFYEQIIEKYLPVGGSVLEVACGTGRIAIRLARKGIAVVGLDSSKPMLDMAREKSQDLSNIQWEHGDMSDFDLGRSFPLIIIPAHSFQNLDKSTDHLAALTSIRKHLDSNGILVMHIDHLNLTWLGDLIGEGGGKFNPAGSFIHPITKQQIEAQHAWSYDPITQTAIGQTIWESVDLDGGIIESWDTGPLKFHCFFPFEMEHLLARSGFSIDHLYGDFNQDELSQESSEMIWIVRKRD